MRSLAYIKNINISYLEFGTLVEVIFIN